MRDTLVRLAVLGFVSTTAACTSFWQLGASSTSREGVSSSLVDYLYPKGEQPPAASDDIPRLDLPLRVGIAFVPAASSSTGSITEATKTELLSRVRDQFKDRDYIQHIEVIPDTYLRSSQGFSGMQQVARLYGVDVMALVSYDQVAISEDKKSSLLYWTIVGAYFIEGTENDVQTFVDTAVFDVSSRKLLFRAPGIDKRQTSSTAVQSLEAVRRSREAGFSTAMENMTGNLVLALDDFEEQLQENPALAQVNWDSSKGGGGFAGYPLVLLLILACFARSRRAAVR